MLATQGICLCADGRLFRPLPILRKVPGARSAAAADISPRPGARSGPAPNRARSRAACRCAPRIRSGTGPADCAPANQHLFGGADAALALASLLQRLAQFGQRMPGICLDGLGDLLDSHVTPPWWVGVTPHPSSFWLGSRQVALHLADRWGFSSKHSSVARAAACVGAAAGRGLQSAMC